jgi:hypothetical protein
MPGGNWQRAKGGLWLFLAWGCQHQVDAAVPASPSASGVDGGSTEGPPETGVSAEANAPTGTTGTAATVAVDTPDASAEKRPEPTISELAEFQSYPPSALYKAFTDAKQKLIACYLPGKKKDPKLRGKVSVKFTINPNGTAKPVANEGSTLQDDDVIACVVRTVKTIHFTKPIDGTATVVYPLIFRPTGDETLILPDAGSKSP